MADHNRVSTLTDRERDVVERLARHGSEAAARGDMWLATLCRVKAREVFEWGVGTHEPLPAGHVLRRLGRAAESALAGR